MLTWIAVPLLSSSARADCCRVVRIAPADNAWVRACEPDVAGACGLVLAEQELTPEGSVWVCTAGETIVYQEIDPTTGSYAAPVGALCDGDLDVEL